MCTPCNLKMTLVGWVIMYVHWAMPLHLVLSKFGLLEQVCWFSTTPHKEPLLPVTFQIHIVNPNEEIIINSFSVGQLRLLKPSMKYFLNVYLIDHLKNLRLHQPFESSQVEWFKFQVLFPCLKDMLKCILPIISQ